ncbi:MAG TPA: gliding motility-associated C-terminal domain-containing protein [Herpetosiphonaceae bacterium]
MNTLRLLIKIFGVTCIVLVLSACAQREVLSNVSTSTNVITPNGDGVDDALTINYSIGVPATISVSLEDQAGQRYVLRDNQRRVPSNQPYALVFDGTVQGGEPSIVQQVLPDGTYTYLVEATPLAGSPPISATGEIIVREAADQPPSIEDLSVTEQFSPNEDADDDVAYFTYRLPVTATVTINFTDQNNTQIPFIAELEEGPFAQSHIWDGKRPDGSLVSTGTYTYTIVARDRVGNIVQRQGQIEVVAPGRSTARITFAQIAPVRVALGSAITVTVRVKNTGNVPIKTQGPPSGYQYSTDDIFSSIEEHTWDDKGGGFWRVALDWGGGHGYPFRWAMSPRPMEQWAKPGEWDYLQPGEEVEITGSVRIEQREDRMQFYVGLAHEGVGYPVNNVARTLVCVGIPNVEARCPRD